MFGEQQRSVEFAVHDSLDGFQFQGRQQFVGALDIGGRADQVVELTGLLEHIGHLVFLRDISRDRDQGLWFA